MADLSPDLVAAIRNARGCGCSERQIARHFGLPIDDVKAALTTQPAWKQEPKQEAHR